MNKVMLIGRVDALPELRYSPEGAPVCILRLAIDSPATDAEGNATLRTEWHRVVVFSRMAEACGHRLKRGALVYVEGRLQTRTWQDKNGQDRYTTEIRTENVRFLERRDGDGAPQFTAPAGEPPVGKSRGGKYLDGGAPSAPYGRNGGRQTGRAAEPPQDSPWGGPQGGYGSEDSGRPRGRTPRGGDDGFGGGYEGFEAPSSRGTSTPDDPFGDSSTMDGCPF